jgi:ubiquitin-like 1-activating enzyme E1 A
MVEQQKLDDGEVKVYDRQLRLWGFESQKRMKESKVLLLNLSSPITELSRHLALSGINLHLVDYENQHVEEHSISGDFLFSEQDKGKMRGDVIKDKLSEMNPFATIKFLKD